MPQQRLQPAVRPAPKLSPGQRQSLAVLAMNRMELQELIAGEQLENPLLEVDGDSASPDILREEAQYMSRTPQAENPREGRELSFPETPAPAPDPVRASLREQIFTPSLSRAEQVRAERLLDLCDPHGFLPYSNQELSLLFGISEEEAAASRTFLQGLEPSGTGSKSVGEFLLFQLRRRGLSSEEEALFSALCLTLLEPLAARDYRSLSAKLGKPPAELRRCTQRIARLRPFPLVEGMSSHPAEYQVPDVIIREKGSGFQIELGDRWTKSVQISPYYRIYQAQDSSPEVQEYLREKLLRARELIRALEQRQNTLLQISSLLVERQPEFFQGGPLRTLPVQEAASQLGLHESTVSRAVRGKFLQCRRGIFPMRQFFSAGGIPEKDRPAALAPSSIQERITAWITAEDPAHPLSDAQLCTKLGEEGIPISRRTVAKYRLEAGIPGTADRRLREP